MLSFGIERNISTIPNQPEKEQYKSFSMFIEYKIKGAIINAFKDLIF